MANIEIPVQTVVVAPPPEAWRLYTDPVHVRAWCAPHPGLVCTRIATEMRPGGRHAGRLEARDGSYAYDFSGRVQAAAPPWRLAIALDHGVTLTTRLSAFGSGTLVRTAFTLAPLADEGMQRTMLQGLLDNFRDYVAARAAREAAARCGQAPGGGRPPGRTPEGG